MKVEVQFLNNRNRPAGFTEFFLVDRDLDQVLAEARKDYQLMRVLVPMQSTGHALYREAIVSLVLLHQSGMRWQMKASLESKLILWVKLILKMLKQEDTSLLELLPLDKSVLFGLNQ